MLKYKTEGKKEKNERLKKEAALKKDHKEVPKKEKPMCTKYGLNHVTTLVENGKAQLVAIAHNVEPIELVLHLPALCRKKGIPYCFIKGTNDIAWLTSLGMERLGKVVNKKSATCVAITEVKKEVS